MLATEVDLCRRGRLRGQLYPRRHRVGDVNDDNLTETFGNAGLQRTHKIRYLKRLLQLQATTANITILTDNHGVPGSNPDPANY